MSKTKVFTAHQENKIDLTTLINTWLFLPISEYPVFFKQTLSHR